MAEEGIELEYLTTVDYIILAVVLAISLGIGVYHGIRGNTTTEEFLLASGSLSPVPVACSMMVTYLSSVSILGYTSEVYGYGIKMYWMVPGFIFGLLITINIILPVFYNLKLRSINEYMVLRFKSRILKKMMLIMNTVNQILLLGIFLYAPSLALAAISPISSDTWIPILGTIVTLYCSVGGMKAVVWTDLFQTIILFLGVVIITASSLWHAGGLSKAWQIARENGRLEFFDMKIGLYERHTTINAFVLGMTNLGYVMTFSQAFIQRITTQRSLRNAKGVIYAHLVGTSILLTLIFVGGLGIYSVYHGCDPISLGLIDKRDQIMPFYVMQRLGHLTGVPGLFAACLFCGTLSSISSTLNAVPTMLWNDCLAELQYFRNASENAKTLFNKLLTLCLGVGMISLAFVASRTRGVIQAAMTIWSIVAGPLAGVFVMGVAVPCVGKRGAIVGFLTSIAFMTWIIIGYQLYAEATPMLPLDARLCSNSTEGLTSNATNISSLSVTTHLQRSHPLWLLYNISYTYFPLIGTIVCFAVGTVVTIVTGCESWADVEPDNVIQCLKKKVGSSNSTVFQAEESFALV